MRPLCLRGSTTKIEEIDNKKGLFAQLFEPKLVKLGKMAFLRIFQQQKCSGTSKTHNNRGCWLEQADITWNGTIEVSFRFFSTKSEILAKNWQKLENFHQNPDENSYSRNFRLKWPFSRSDSIKPIFVKNSLLLIFYWNVCENCWFGDCRFRFAENKKAEKWVIRGQIFQFQRGYPNSCKILSSLCSDNSPTTL